MLQAGIFCDFAKTQQDITFFWQKDPPSPKWLSWFCCKLKKWELRNTVTQPKKVTITNYIQVIVIITCNYRYFTHCNWPNSGWYITWHSVVFENCFYQQWQCVCMCFPIVRWWSLRRKMGPHFLHFGKWLRYTWQNGSITKGDISFLNTIRGLTHFCY